MPFVLNSLLSRTRQTNVSGDRTTATFHDFDDIELEARLHQREHILDIVHPTGNRFEQEDVFWTHELDHEISRVEIAFAPENSLRSSSVLPLVSLAGTPLTNAWRQNQFANHLLVEDVDTTPVIVLEDALGTEFFVLFARFPDDIVS